MTRSEVERAVCRATGESRHLVRSYGFSLIDPESGSIGDPSLMLDCPGCGAPLDACFASGPLKFVECPRCDAVYPFSVDEIYVTENSKTALPACA
jgi:uncharacterized C2H2 Zn-finger protein